MISLVEETLKPSEHCREPSGDRLLGKTGAAQCAPRALTNDAALIIAQ